MLQGPANLKPYLKGPLSRMQQLSGVLSQLDLGVKSDTHPGGIRETSSI